MPRPIVRFVHVVDRFNRSVGRVTMYMIFVLAGLLLFTSISKAAFNVSYLWSFELAQMMLTAYYILGGPYSMQLGSHVRMDLFYSRWSPRRRAAVDAFTCIFLLTYLVVLLLGGISSTEYALTYGQTTNSAWRPKLWPIKVIMCVGIVLMLLQTLAVLFRDIAAARGRPIPPVHEAEPVV
jgi:TRAP-type mannitol/chloroaromatic compound transport system permease small subunit